MTTYPGIERVRNKELYKQVLDFSRSGLTDMQICAKLNMHQAQVHRWRNQYAGLPIKSEIIKTALKGEQWYATFLNNLGFQAELTEFSCPYDILVDKHLRVEVKSAERLYKDRLFFSLLTTGTREQKDYSEACDFIVFVWLETFDWWLLPSNHKFCKRFTVAFNPLIGKPFKPFKNNLNPLLQAANKQRAA